MPATTFAITRNLRGAWSDYWKNRPMEEPLDLPTVLDSATVLEQRPDGVPMRPGMEVWVHPSLPAWYFVVVVNEFERVVAGFRPFRRAKKPKTVIEKPVVVPRLAHPVEPSGLSLHARRDWWESQFAEAVGGVKKSFDEPDRLAWGARQKQCEERLSALNAEIRAANAAECETVETKAERAAKALLETEPDTELRIGSKGNIDFLPVVLWLLREVKQLRAANQTPTEG